MAFKFFAWKVRILRNSVIKSYNFIHKSGKDQCVITYCNVNNWFSCRKNSRFVHLEKERKKFLFSFLVCRTLKKLKFQLILQNFPSTKSLKWNISYYIHIFIKSSIIKTSNNSQKKSRVIKFHVHDGFSTPMYNKYMMMMVVWKKKRKWNTTGN